MFGAVAVTGCAGSKRTFVALMEWPMRLLQKKNSHVFCVGENGRSLVLLERQRQSAELTIDNFSCEVD